MWEISNKLQIFGFLYSIALGMIFSAFYDVLRAFRAVKRSKAVLVFTQDIFYFIIISFISFIFFLAITNGEIRAYILFGMILGFTLFNLLLSRYLLKVLTAIFKALRLVFRRINKAFYWIFERIDRGLIKIFKKGLKIAKGLLYTIKKAV